jgi:TrmH family RNA methyltransferase
MRLGRHHPLLKRVRNLRRSAEARRQEGLLVAEGLHLAREALRSRQRIEAAFVDPRLPGSVEGTALLRDLEQAGVTCYQVATSVMGGLQDARSPQPVVLTVRAEGLVGRSWRTREHPLVVVCDAIQDPGNLGAISRSADAAGAAALITCGASADLHHPRTLRASMGSMFRLPAEHMQLDEAVDRLRAEDLTLIATVPRGGEDFRRNDWTRGCAVFFGGEGVGLSDALVRRLDRSLTIALHPGVESLSVGAAVAVTLFEAARQRGSESSSAWMQ